MNLKFISGSSSVINSFI
jgi:hypothetical protein